MPQDINSNGIPDNRESQFAFNYPNGYYGPVPQKDDSNQFKSSHRRPQQQNVSNDVNGLKWMHNLYMKTNKIALYLIVGTLVLGAIAAGLTAAFGTGVAAGILCGGAAAYGGFKLGKYLYNKFGKKHEPDPAAAQSPQVLVHDEQRTPGRDRTQGMDRSRQPGMGYDNARNILLHPETLPGRDIPMDRLSQQAALSQVPIRSRRALMQQLNIVLPPSEMRPVNMHPRGNAPQQGIQRSHHGP